MYPPSSLSVYFLLLLIYANIRNHAFLTLLKSFLNQLIFRKHFLSSFLFYIQSEKFHFIHDDYISSLISTKLYYTFQTTVIILTLPLSFLDELLIKVVITCNHGINFGSGYVLLMRVTPHCSEQNGDIMHLQYRFNRGSEQEWSVLSTKYSYHSTLKLSILPSLPITLTFASISFTIERDNPNCFVR